MAIMAQPGIGAKERKEQRWKALCAVAVVSMMADELAI